MAGDTDVQRETRAGWALPYKLPEGSEADLGGFGGIRREGFGPVHARVARGKGAPSLNVGARPKLVLEGDVADLQHGTYGKRARPCDALAIDEGAVRGAEI